MLQRNKETGNILAGNELCGRGVGDGSNGRLEEVSQRRQLSPEIFAEPSMYRRVQVILWSFGSQNKDVPIWNQQIPVQIQV